MTTLLDKIFQGVEKPKKSPEERVEEALQKALDNMTLELSGRLRDKENAVDGEETDSGVS